MTRAHVSCESNKTPVDSHFRDTTKMVTAGVAARAVKDFKLTRYACYLIAQNGDQTSQKSRSPRRTSRCRHAGFPIPRVDSICESGCALTGSTPCKVNKKDGQPKLTVLTCFGGPSGGQLAAQAAAAAPRRLARCAGKRLRVFSAPRPFGFDPM